MSVQSSLVIDSRVEEIGRARRWLGEHARQAGFPAKVVGGMGLALTEACANIIEHSYQGKAGGTIELHLTIDATRLVLTLRDYGRPFDLSQYKPPDLDQPHEGGYGVYLIRSLMDSVEYDSHGEQGTTLTLVKNRGDSG